MHSKISNPTASPPWPDAARRWLALVALLFAVACGRPDPPLEEVAEPPDLAQLDLAVREQLEELWTELKAAEGDARGSAWGALGMWFDVYQYADSAGRCYRNARRLDPDDPRWPYHLGRLAEAAGEPEAAADHYRSAAELAPGQAAPRVRLGDLALERQQLDRAEELYREVLEERPQSPGALLGIGRLALLRGDGAAALEPLETLAKLQPEASQVIYSLGLAWRLLGDEERATEQMGRVPEDNLDQIALALDSPWDDELQQVDRGARTLTRQAVRAFRRGEHGRAAVLFGQAVAADPRGAEKRINYALALAGTKHWREAVEQLEEALRLAEEGSDLAHKAHLELGRLLATLGQPARAEHHLEASLAGDPDSLPARLELGKLYHRQGRLAEALEHYASARASDRAIPETRFWHAAVLLLLDRRQGAREALEEDLEHLGGDRGIRLLLARLLSAAPEDGPRDLARARALLESADGERDVFFAETAAMVEAGAGRFAAATAWQEATLDGLDGVRLRSAVHTARRRLALYRQGEPCRTPWEARETVIRLPVRTP